MVLLVDDDTMFTALLAAQLAVHGFATREAASAQDAWAAVHALPELRGAICDASLAGDGVKLAIDLHATRPDLALIVVSGVSRLELHERGLPDAVVSVQKPISSSELISLLSAAGVSAPHE